MAKRTIEEHGVGRRFCVLQLFSRWFEFVAVLQLKPVLFILQQVIWIILFRIIDDGPTVNSCLPYNLLLKTKLVLAMLQILWLNTVCFLHIKLINLFFQCSQRFFLKREVLIIIQSNDQQHVMGFEFVFMYANDLYTNAFKNYQFYLPNVLAILLYRIFLFCAVEFTQVFFQVSDSSKPCNLVI